MVYNSFKPTAKSLEDFKIDLFEAFDELREDIDCTQWKICRLENLVGDLFEFKREHSN